MFGPDLCKGDTVEWSEGVFEGSWKKPRFLGERIIRAEIVKDSYGAGQGTHTLTLRVISAEGEQAPEEETIIRRKAATVYEHLREQVKGAGHAEAAEEKHQRAETQAARNRHRNCGGVFINGICQRCFAPNLGI